MIDKYLPYSTQWIEEDDIDAVVDVLRGTYLTTGPTIDAFERAFAEYVGAPYAVAFSSGTAALHAAVLAAGIGPGDEVITTPMTFAATSNAVLYAGGVPVFADIRPDTYNIDVADVERKITSRTKALLPVDYTGQPADLGPLRELADQYRLLLIEDAAHALGATYRGRRVGSIADMTIFSFHPVKHITTGEGGMVTTHREDLAERLRLIRSHGIVRDPTKWSKNEGPWYYEMHDLGYNYRMTDIQAALGLSQLKKVDRFIVLRKKYAAMYNAAFADNDALIVPYQSPDGSSSWHLYVLRLRLEALSITRREIFDALIRENIGVNVHYIPVYWHPYYAGLGYRRGLCPEAERHYEAIITLPLYPKMIERDVIDVIDAIDRIVKRGKR
ncbi:UDP-4-amino-4,6-dideoxy-N-acetyl-beta-L-altrosamine transaminase [Hydrogenibacillus schlegelii]|uniref:UDP-4-amino-4, 6-dideoxy-N-acetyl-beta-L-altrosamine transaminase n=1 Tax=Hydrogenibacillus schlegelii TaxID=1484 RepID=UPI0007961707|nr:UDP-4-amino-4,6-dideoxy-N-acetyl-beta-L-altrosamine transaminase [Hydrogenibacillus schlegelii]KWX07438.1 aminotransferase DegT [Hydrogenibacillus schlegelii]